MKQLYFGFFLLISPAFVWATDSVKCNCVTDDKEFAVFGELRQYHEILSALEKAEKKDVVEIVYKLEKIVIADNAKPQQDSAFKTEIIKLCRDIAGDSAKAFISQSESLWKLLYTEKDPVKIDAYKARLACFAIQSRKYLIVEDSTKTKDLEDQIHDLSNNILQWKAGGIIGGVLLLALTVVGIWLFNREKKRNSIFENSLIDKLKEIETEKNQLIADQSSLIESNEFLKKAKAKIPVVKEEPQNLTFHQPYTPPPPARKIYARPPSGNILFQVSDSFEPQTTYFVIEINPADETIGKLLLVDDNATLFQAFSTIDTLRDACELRSTGAPTSISQLIKNIPGEVVMENGYWKIKRKIILEW